MKRSLCQEEGPGWLRAGSELSRPYSDGYSGREHKILNGRP